MHAGRMIFTLLFAALIAVFPAKAQEKPIVPQLGERVLSFSSDIVVARDGTLTVTETIRVRSQGMQIQRGIYRDFPTRYQRDGRTIRVGFDVEAVQRNGEDENWTTESIDNGKRIRIGSEDVFLPDGEHVYTIRYRTTRQLGFFDDYDELYWNVTGNGWAFPIDEATAQIRLPQTVRFGNRAFYTGPQGSKETNAEVVEEQPGLISIRATRPLGAYEGMTIAVAWPKGVVEEPAPPSPRAEWLEDKSPLIAGGLAIAGLCFFYFYAWKRAGRGPISGTIVPLFAPPQGLSAAAVRYISRMGYDSRAFASALVESGVRGKIRLVEEDGGIFSRDKTRVEKVAEPDDMPAPERSMLRALFVGGSTIEMDKKNHATFRSAQNQLQQSLASLYRGKLFLTNKGWAVVGLVLLLIAMAFVGVAVIATDVYGEPGMSLVPWLAVGLLALALGLGIRSRLVRKEGSLASAIFAVLLAIAGSVALIATIPFAAESGRAWAIFLPMLTLPLAISAFWWMAAPTREGRRMMDEIAGFERYLSVTEEDRLERLHPPEKTPELFERFLPYAIALDVENRWASRFADVLAAAATNPEDRNRMSWYSGSHSPWSNPGRFAAAMGGSLASAASAASTAPGSSSGSGGGGSSGGGGGGGGGGGW